jgi:hypothetical protein
MAGKPPSFSDIISKFANPTPPSSPAQEWLSDLTKFLEGGYEKLVHPEREPGLHASGLHEVCARREAIFEVFGRPVKKLKAGNQLTYGFGHAMHFWWQHRYLGPKQELWGNWMCTACCHDLCDGKGCDVCQKTGRKVTLGFMPLKCECGLPWQDTIRYLEMPVENKDLGYVGHTDGILIRTGQTKKTVFEFKTDGPSSYDDREAPDHKHIIQAHAYMEPLKIDEALIVYQSKAKQCDWEKRGHEWTASQIHIKPYFIKFDPVIWGPIVWRIREHHEARAYLQKILDEDKRPGRDDITKFKKVCDSQRCQMARDCPVASQCFSLP